MARRYRRRRNESPLDGLIGLAVLGGGVWVWQSWQEYGQIITYAAIAIVAGVLVIVGALAIWRYRRDRRRLRALDVAAIDTMDALEFEVYVAKLLKHRGFTNVQLTERFDYGVDVIAEKDGIRWGVQVKHYNNMVKAAAVRQVVTALVRYKCDRAMVVANNVFSRPAKELAADNKCVLIDRDALTEWIVQFQDSGTK